MNPPQHRALGRMPIDTAQSLVRLRQRVLGLCEAAGLPGTRATRVATGLSELTRATLRHQPNFIFEAALLPDRISLAFLGVNHLPKIPVAVTGYFDRLRVAGEAGGDAWLEASVLLPPAADAARLQTAADRLFALTPADRMLRVILPDPIAEELTTYDAVQTRRHENVAVLFADVVGFTSFCDQREPDEVVEHLQAFTQTFERVAEKWGVEKIKTIGDCFMAAAGIPEPVDQPVNAAVSCGLEMIRAARHLASGWQLRMGVHIGPVIAGVVGGRRFAYDLWGDTVNTAARVESNGVAGRVNLSQAAFLACQDQFTARSSGKIQLKGKGLMELYTVEEPTPLPTAAERHDTSAAS